MGPSRSPSPAPPRPVALTPGPRASQFQNLYNNALTHTLRTCSYVNFSSCFPTPAKHAPQVLTSIWQQVTQQVGERSKGEFEAIMKEKDVVGGLNNLERLIGEAKARKARGEEGGEPPHTLPPERLYVAHLAHYLRGTEIELEAELNALEVENEEMVEEIRAQGQEVERLVGGLESVIADLEGANDAMGGVVEGGEMNREVMEIEDELKGMGRDAKL